MAYTTVSSGLGGNTTWTAGTYYLTANVTMGSYNLTFDCSGGSIFIKTSGAVGIQQNGTGVLTTANTSITNKVIFTSHNDNAHGDAITGSSGSPASADQTASYVLLTGTGNFSLIYFELWYWGSAGAISTDLTASHASQNFTLQYGKLKYGVIPSGVSSPNLIGIRGTGTGYNYIFNNVLLDNLVIDNTNIVSQPSVGSSFVIWMNGATQSTVSNNFINPTFSGTLYPYVYGVYLEGGAGTPANLVVKNNVFLGANLSLVGRGATYTSLVENNVITIGANRFFGDGAILAEVTAGTSTVTIKNNIIYNCTWGTVYGINIALTGTTINEDYNDFYGNHSNSYKALGAHSLSNTNPSLTNVATGTINPSFAIPNGYAIVSGGALDKAGSDTFGNLGWDVTQYSPTGYKYASTDKINIGILYNITFPAVVAHRHNGGMGIGIHLGL
jgi:hypothetical protein